MPKKKAAKPKKPSRCLDCGGKGSFDDGEVECLDCKGKGKV
jgi:DnaJ-class molecular chaperone